MGWETSNRKNELPRGWATIRRRILARDGYSCRWPTGQGSTCGVAANQVDHVIRGSDHRDENLRALCKWHHNRKTSQEGVVARKVRRG